MAQQIDYNLTDNAKESFNFQMGDLVYNFRYPTTRELREIGVLNEELKELAEKKADKAVIEAKSKESEEKMNTLVTPVGHENPIGTVLEDQPINVVKNFRSMMAREISLE